MAEIKLKGTVIHTNGELPCVGSIAPDFELVKNDLSTLTLNALRGKRVVLYIFPSLDTPTCAMSVRRFNKEASALDNTWVLAISKDLPFASARFCSTEGIENVIPLSAFRSDAFERAYGMLIVDGPLSGLLARGVAAIDENGKVLYSRLVAEVTDEPDYASVLEALKG